MTESEKIEWPDPTPDELKSPVFEAIWQVIKTWDINVPGAYAGYMGAIGNHAAAILHGISPALKAAYERGVQEAGQAIVIDADREKEQARDDALEQAAKIALEWSDSRWDRNISLAERIRALKPGDS